MKSALFLWQARFALAIPGVSALLSVTQSPAVGVPVRGAPPGAGSQSKAGRVSPTPRGSKPTRSKDSLSDGDVAAKNQLLSPETPGPPGLAKSVPILAPEAGSFCRASVNFLPVGLL
ncbi:unannotated protein [freshwater metagenome]|uniref:Unannotated protein n=1 Tax=freshwater metagenome TaxID=449393 RepID=A0A6J7S4U3_9ZZZZ